MNTQTYTRTCVVSLCLLLCAPFNFLEARSAEPQTREAGILIDCAKPSLPNQRKVGDMAGQHNFGQVYATRNRVMIEVRRVCQRKGATQVLVQQLPQKEQNRMAVQSPAR